MIREAIGEESKSHILLFDGKVQTHRQAKVTGQKQIQEHSQHYQRDCSQRIPPGMPNSQFGIQLWHFMVTA
jgi:hypothetical protein